MKKQNKEYEAAFFTHEEDLAKITIPAPTIVDARKVARSLKQFLSSRGIIPAWTKTVVEKKNY